MIVLSVEHFEAQKIINALGDSAELIRTLALKLAEQANAQLKPSEPPSGNDSE